LLVLYSVQYLFLIVSHSHTVAIFSIDWIVVFIGKLIKEVNRL